MPFVTARTVRVLAAVLLVLSLDAHAIIGDTSRPVLEYFNAGTGHYVLLSEPAEIAYVDAGGAGPGWKRTGYEFTAYYAVPQSPLASVAPVCRFYAPGPNSHFMTAFADECRYLRSHDTGWNFEKEDFLAYLPQDGSCPAPLQPVHRFYNARAAQNDSNHRFTPDPNVRVEMVARGWIDEGVAFCTIAWYFHPAQSFAIAPGRILAEGQCEIESINLGSCVGLNQIAAMPNTILAWSPPFNTTRGANWSPAFEQLTGSDADVHTAQRPDSAHDVAAHSFVQSSTLSRTLGIHVNSIDRTVGMLASINPVYQFRTTAPAEGAAEGRVFPWRERHRPELIVSFNLRVKTARHAPDGSHAYGHPTLQFKDLASGEHLYVTLGTFGTQAAADFVAVDASTNRVIVSTYFRDRPLFGAASRGRMLRCDAGGDIAGTCEQPQDDLFRFSIGRGDFQRVLELARDLHPSLSANPDDYIMANFHFNNEVLGNAQLGLSLHDFRLDLFEHY